MLVDKNLPLAAAEPGADTFFLPELCNVSATVFLVLVAELLALVISLAAGQGPGIDWEALALTSLFTQWVVLASAAILCQLRGYLGRFSLPLAAGISYFVILVVALCCSLVGQRLGLTQPGGAEPVIEPTRSLNHLLITAILAGIALRYFYLQQQLRLQREAELRARIEALQARIRPHFLFNSMNSIASLIASDPQLAEQVVEDLADLFRQSLAREQTEIPLDEELELCRRFVRIESLRLGQRLEVNWRIDDLPPGLKIPRFTLQPLIENAIYHGIQPLPAGGCVSVDVAIEGESCRMRVQNPVASDAPARSGNRMALQNISHRLKALYGPEASVDVDRGESQFSVAIAYPLANMGLGSQ